MPGTPTPSELELVFSMSLDLICIADIKTATFQKVNPAFTRVLGFSAEELLQKPFLSLIHPDDVPATRSVLETDLSQGRKVTHFENRYRCKDGSYRWLSWVSHPFPDSGLTFAIARDVTDQHQARNELLHSHALLQYIVEHTRSAVAVHDRDLRYIYVSQQYLREYNVREPNIIGKHHYEVFPDLPQKWRDVHQRALAGEVVSAEDDPFYRDDGSMEWTRWECRPWYEGDGSIGGIVVYTEVITDRINAREALRKSEEHLRALIAASPLAIVGIDGDGRVLSWNAAAERTFGWTEAEVLGNTVPTVPEDQQDEFFGLVRRVLNGETRSQVELTRRRKDGTPVEISLSTSPLRGGHGEEKGLVAIMEDISARKRAERENKLLQEKLTQAQKMESVGRLAGGVAHDFNNMLSVIQGHLDLILDDFSPQQPWFESLMEIRKAAQRSSDLTRQLLAFARKQTIAPRVLDLNRTVQGTLNMLRRLIGEDVDLSWIPGQNLGAIHMDPSQIDQILTNLCINARDAIDSSGNAAGKITIETTTITIDAEQFPEQARKYDLGTYVRLTVSDNGCGMDKETLDKLFEPFFTTKNLGKGTGLGLATIYGIVKQNHGFISVYSEIHQGTTFHIYLPQMDASVHAPPPAEATPASTARSETILLVEDEAAILSITTATLKRLGYKVIAANTPSEAIRLAHEHAGSIHLLMTDVVMPEMNGRQLIQRLQMDFPHLRCLYVSGYTANVIAHHGILDEGVHFLQKPYSRAQIAQKLQEILADPPPEK